MKNRLKLFVWEDFSPDYTSGLAFAIARNEKEARKKVEARGFDVMIWGNLSVHPISRTVAFAVTGGG